MNDGDCRLETRRQALICAARAQFGRNGYESTSLADVVGEAGGSLATVYKLFGNKEGLLLAVLSDFDIESLLIEEFTNDDCSPLKHLEQVGLAIHALMTQPDSMMMARLSLSLGLKDLEWARQYDNAMEKMVVEPLTDLFERWCESGILEASEEPAHIAESFVGLLSYPFIMAALRARSPYNLSEEQICHRIRAFARGYRLTDD